MHHDGIMLKPALDVLSGQVLFRDTFTQYGALTCYLQVAALWIQPSLFFLKLQTVAAYAVTLFFLYASWRLILPRSLTLLSSGLFMLFIPGCEKSWINEFWILVPWSSVFAMMFQSIGLYALFRIIRAEQPGRWGLVLGMASAGVFWCRQPVGVIMIGCLVVIGLALHWTGWVPSNHSKRSIIVRVAGGFVAVHALLLGSVVVSGALPEWWYQNYVWPSKWARVSMSGKWSDFIAYYVDPGAGAVLLVLLLAIAAPRLVRKFRPDFSSRGVLVLRLGFLGLFLWQYKRVWSAFALREGGWTALFPLIIFVQALISIGRAFDSRGPPRSTEYYLIAALAALSLGSLLQFYPVADPWHILWSLAPAFGLVVFAIWRWVGGPASVVAVIFMAVLLPAVWTRAQSARQCLSQPLVTLDQPAILRGMKVLPVQARSIGQIMDTLAQVLRYRPDIPCALIGQDAMYLCFARNHANPSPYFVTWVALAETEENKKRWDYILRVRPLMFLHKADWAAVNDFYRRAHYVPLVYVAENALEIAVPQELAEAMGRSAYGAIRDAGSGPKPLKP